VSRAGASALDPTTRATGVRNGRERHHASDHVVTSERGQRSPRCRQPVKAARASTGSVRPAQPHHARGWALPAIRRERRGASWLRKSSRLRARCEARPNAPAKPVRRTPVSPRAWVARAPA